MKDYYDIYYLANKFDFDGKTLTEALKKTFANRDRTFTVEQFDQMLSFANDDAMQKKWTAFCKKVNTESNFDTVLETIRKFLLPPYQAVLNNTVLDSKWTSEKQDWIGHRL